MDPTQALAFGLIDKILTHPEAEKTQTEVNKS